MPVVIAIDAGTTGVRTMAVDESGRPVANAYQEFPQYFPRPGWVEHDPLEIWAATTATIARVASQLDRPIAAVGITNQRETVVVWDRRTGQPLHRAIVWQDRRTADRCRRLEAEGHLGMVRRRTGLVLDPYFSGTKLEWLLTGGPDRAGAGITADPHVAFGTVDSWLLWNLTGGGVHATDPSNASRTLLYDIHELDWSDELTNLLHVPGHVLPEVLPSSGRFGLTADRADTGLPPRIPISGIAGDQQSALFGQACFRPGMTKNTYGTGSFVLMNIGPDVPEPVDGLLTSVAWTLNPMTGAGAATPAPTYTLEGAIFVTGAAVQWLRDGLGIIDDAAETGPLAASVDDTGGVFVVPAFTGLGSPWWDPYARGTIVGLTRGAGRAHLARAVVEAMAYQTRDVVDAMTKAAGHEIAILRVDGGASAMELLLQLQADQLQVPVARARTAETTALGAAYLAGLAEGVWDLDDIARQWAADLTVEPQTSASSADTKYEQWKRAVERTRAWEPATDAGAEL